MCAVPACSADITLYACICLCILPFYLCRSQYAPHMFSCLCAGGRGRGGLSTCLPSGDG